MNIRSMPQTNSFQSVPFQLMATLSGQKKLCCFSDSFVSHFTINLSPSHIINSCTFKIQVYPEFDHFPLPWSRTTIFLLAYCNDFPTGLVCSCPCEHYRAVSSQIMSLLAQNLPVTSCPKSALLVSCFSDLISHYSFSYLLCSRDIDLDLPQTLQGLVYFRVPVLAVFCLIIPWCP